MVNHLFPSLVAKQAQRRQEAINAHLVLSLAQLLLGVLEGARGKGGDLTTQRAVEMPLSAVGCSLFWPELEVYQNNPGRRERGCPYVRLFWKPLKASILSGFGVLYCSVQGTCFSTAGSTGGDRSFAKRRMRG